MDRLNFEEYRCSCGKLLFKAFIVVSLIEVKCKRCGNIGSFGNTRQNKSSFFFLLFVDSKGIIRDMCKGAEMILGCSRKNLLGTPIMNICPLIYDRIFSRTTDTLSCKLLENNFILNNGEVVPTETYFIGPDPESGYYIFSKHKLAAI